MNTYCNTEIKKMNSNGVRLQQLFGSFEKRCPDLCKTIVCVKQIVGIAQIVSGWNGRYLKVVKKISKPLLARKSKTLLSAHGRCIVPEKEKRELNYEIQ